MAYVYRHIKLDNNTPFYIKINSNISYKRAYKIPYKVKYVLDGK